MKFLEALLSLVIAIITTVAVVVPVMILTGFVVADLWSWFIVPVFEMQELTLGQSIGLSLIVSFMCKYNKLLNTEEEDEKALKALRNRYIYILTAWGIGYVLHLIIN